MYNIQTLNKIAAIGTDIFDKEKYAIADECVNPDAILVRSGDMHNMDFGDNLLAIARAGAGTNNIPSDECAKQGICVFNTPGANANAVKELVLTGLFLSSREIIQGISWADTLKGNGAEVEKMVEKGKSQFVGPEIARKTLGVIGLGAIGVLIANAAVSLGMKVIGFDPYLSVKSAWQLSPGVVAAKSAEEVYASADYITIHVPYNPNTKGTIDEKAISQMKDGVRVLNFSRGELVDNSAIIPALESGKIAKYVTDFPSDEVIGVKNVIAIPHLGASTPESEDNCAVMAVNQIVDYIENGNIINSVNLPNAEMARSGKTRICMIHKNIPDVLTQTTAAVCGVNIENMINQSKQDYAYTMFDISDCVSDEIIEKIKNISGMIKVRVLNNC